MEIYVNYGISIVHPNFIYVHYYVKEMSTHIHFGGSLGTLLVN
jgi:hypothetical protein